MSTFWQDIRYGVRMLIKAPGFTIVALLTLALGIAATTAIFTVVDGVLLRQLPVSEPSQVCVIHNQLPKLNLPRTPVSPLQYLDYGRASNVFESTAAIAGRNFNLTGMGIPEQLQAGRVTASFFPTIGVNPVAGRFFNSEEDRAGNEHVVVLSMALWKRAYSSSHDALDSTIQLNGQNYRIVGVISAIL